MKFKGTKGPWVYDKDQEGVCSKNGYIIADIFPGDQEDNAILISKAPEMLEMLKWCLLDDNLNEYTRKRIEQLIKSATEI